MRLEKKSETAKAEPPKVEAPQDGPAGDGSARLRGITTDAPDVKARTKFEEPQLTPPRRGPVTGRSMPDVDFIAMNATEMEKKTFRAVVQARMAKGTANIWRHCNSPSCGLVMPERASNPEGSRCIKCNFTGALRGGRMQNMTEQEIAEYLAGKEARDRAERDRIERAAFNKRNGERRAAGLPDFTLDEFRAERNADYEARTRQDRTLGEGYTQAARIRQAEIFGKHKE